MKITEPVKIIKSDVYALVLQDANGIYHYFKEYDGWSRDCVPVIEINLN